MSRKILVVEDDVGLRELVSEVLRDAELVVCESPDGRDALRRIHSGEVFDAILTDIAMPQLDGLAFLKSLRKNSILTPVIILSGLRERSAVLEALRLGAYDFFEKPCDLTKLLNVIKSAAEIGVAIRQLISAVRISEVTLQDEQSRVEVIRFADEVVRTAMANAKLAINPDKKVG
jgi:DNA-binding NtrC family response regulator